MDIRFAINKEEHTVEKITAALKGRCAWQKWVEPDVLQTDAFRVKLLLEGSKPRLVIQFDCGAPTLVSQIHAVIDAVGTGSAQKTGCLVLKTAA